MKIFRKIIDGKFGCPKSMSADAKNIVQSMLQKQMVRDMRAI